MNGLIDNTANIDRLQEMLEAVAKAVANGGTWDVKGAGTKWRARLSDIQVTELPEHLGKLFADLGVQKEFSLMGRHIRTFEDASFVVHHMRRLLQVRMEAEGTLRTLNLVNEIIALCEEMISQA